jgi:DNA segregation ATPase FtsK/SpoIIIE-like protein
MKYVYILKAGENHYKVGIAKSVFERIKSIQTGNANHVYIVATKLCNDAMKVEKMLHKKLESMSTGNGGREWFRLEPEDVVRLCIMLNMQPEVDVYDNTTLNDQLREQTLRHKRLERKLDAIINIAQKPRSTLFAIPKETDDLRDTPIFDKEEDRNLLQEAIVAIREGDRASTSYLQRRLRIGYGRAARLMDELEVKGIVGKLDGSRAREILLEA